MPLDYYKMKALVLQKILLYGQFVEYLKKSESSTNPNKPWEKVSTVESFNIPVIFTAFDDRAFDKTYFIENIKESKTEKASSYCVLPAPDLFVPKVNDVIVRDGKEKIITRVSDFAPGNVILYYSLNLES